MQPGTITRTARRALLALVLLGLCLAAWAQAAGQPAWRISVRDAACSYGPRVQLGEIAEIYGEPPAGLWERLSARELWNNPERTGRQVTVNREQLERLLRHYVPEVGQSWVLPSQLTVQYGGLLLERREIEKKVVEFLTPRAAGLGGEAEFKDFRLPEGVFVDNGSDTVAVDLAGPLAPGRVGLRLTVLTPDGKIVKRLSASVFMNLWKAVPSASKPLNRMHPLEPDDVTFMRRNLAYIPDVWDGSGGPWRIAQPVGKGQPITKAHLEPLPAVARGEKVMLVYQGERIQMAVKAEALSDGDVGQTVAVRNLQTKKEISGTVVDSHTVLVR